MPNKDNIYQVLQTQTFQLKLGKFLTFSSNK